MAKAPTTLPSDPPLAQTRADFSRDQEQLLKLKSHRLTGTVFHVIVNATCCSHSPMILNIVLRHAEQDLTECAKDLDKNNQNPSTRSHFFWLSGLSTAIFFRY